MSKIKGQNFRLFVSEAAVPEATNCQITITGNMEDASTKDTEGLFSQEQMVSTSWQAQVDSYVADAASVQSLIRVFVAASAVTVGFDQTTGDSGTENQEAAGAAFARSGSALLTDLTLQFNDRATCTVTSQYQGSGALS